MTRRKCGIGRVLKRDYALARFPGLCAGRAKRKLHDAITDDACLLAQMQEAGWSDHSLWLTLREQRILQTFHF